MSAKRFFLTVLLVFLPSACAGTDTRGQDGPGEIAAQPGAARPPIHSIVPGPTKTEEKPQSLPVARKRPTPPPTLQTFVPRPVVPAAASEGGAAAGDESPVAAVGKGGAEDKANMAKGTVVPAMASGGGVAAGDESPVVEAGKDGAGDRTNLAKEPTAPAVAVSASAQKSPVIAGGPTNESSQIAAMRPEGQDIPSGAATADDAASKIDPPISPRPPSFEERSLECDVIKLFGEALGRWRRQNEDRKVATDKAIDDVIRQTGGVRDKRFAFSGHVYGLIIYNLDKDHSMEGFGAYAHSACLILRGGKGYVPADETSVARLNQALKTCEAGSPTSGELSGCISKRMEEVVKRRGVWSG